MFSTNWFADQLWRHLLALCNGQFLEFGIIPGFAVFEPRMLFACNTTCNVSRTLHLFKEAIVASNSGWIYLFSSVLNFHVHIFTDTEEPHPGCLRSLTFEIGTCSLKILLLG